MAHGKNILQAIEATADLTVRSPLQDWMRANHDAFAAKLAERRADWDVLAKLFTDNGLTNRYGRPVEAETARKTWQRVRKDVEKARAKRQADKTTEATKAAVESTPRQQTAPLLRDMPPPADDDAPIVIRPVTRK